MPDQDGNLTADESNGRDEHVEGDPAPNVPQQAAQDCDDKIVPQDLPKGHPGRAEAERQARAGDGFARGNV